MQQPLPGALDALLHFNGASRRSVSFQRSNGHCGARKIVVLNGRSRVSGQMPSAVAALIGGEIRCKDIGLAIRRVTAPNQRLGHVQIVVGAAQRSRSFELTSIEARCDLGPSLVGSLLIDSDPFRARGADRESGRRLFVTGETSGLAEELRSRSLQQRNAALNCRPGI